MVELHLLSCQILMLELRQESFEFACVRVCMDMSACVVTGTRHWIIYFEVFTDLSDILGIVDTPSFVSDMNIHLNCRQFF